MIKPFGRLAETVRESNRQAGGRDAWVRFAPHRQRVQALLESVIAPTSSLCLLGPGHANDVDLTRLLEGSAEVHLVDIDLEAVHAGLERRRLAGHPRCHVHGPLDLTGALDLLPTPWAEDPSAVVGVLVETIAERRAIVPGAPFDVTVSTCVLTQLLQSVVDSTLPPEEKVEVGLAVRDKHLSDLLTLTREGGTFVLVSDVVSTSTAPSVGRADESALEAEMAALVAAGNFFTGTNPYRIVALLEEDPRLRDCVVEVELVEPWLWAVTPDREHLTYAILARRH